MKNVFSLRKRSFLSPVSTGYTSHIFAEVESSNEGEYRWGHNMLTIADCRRRVQIEFFLGTKREATPPTREFPAHKSCFLSYVFAFTQGLA
jgi:hypothetical protein